MYLWLCWIFIAAHGLSLALASGVYFSSWWFSSSEAQAPAAWASVAVARGPSSCDTWA